MIPISSATTAPPANAPSGTAGLRAAVGAGPLRMNRLVVRQAAAEAGRARLVKSLDRGLSAGKLTEGVASSVVSGPPTGESAVMAADQAAGSSRPRI